MTRRFDALVCSIRDTPYALDIQTIYTKTPIISEHHIIGDYVPNAKIKFME